MEIYQDRTKTSRQRAENLLGLMTLREKVGQLNQRLYGFQIYEREKENFRITEEFQKEVEHFGGIGVLYGLYRADPWSDKNEETGITPELSMKAYNMLQEYVIRHSRLGIPMMMSSECPHGHQALGGSLLPVNFAAGCTFDPELLTEAYHSVGRQLKEGHVELALMSVLDVMRDPRWGRCEECYSEDPYLSARMAAAAVRGMQSTGVAAVAKHFCAQGEGTGGINASAARIGERELREIHLPPMEACCKEKVQGVMAAYNEIDGVFCHANEHLLRDILRKELGFEGIVMADGIAIDNLNCVTGDTMRSGALALSCGVDVSLWDRGFTLLDQAVEQGMIKEELVDEAVLRVLELKFEMGLFEHPYMEESMKDGSLYGTEELSRKIALESVVLLKNEKKILPLKSRMDQKKRVTRIALIGPNAADRYRQMGDYTPPVPEQKCVTVKEGMEREAKDIEICYSRGCDLLSGSQEELEEAVAAAEKSDVICLVLGGSSSRYEGVEYDANGAAKTDQDRISMECGEGMDVERLELPSPQRDLFHALVKTKKPLITIVIAGRPYALGGIAEKSDALLFAPYGGPYAGGAIAKILLGEAEPSGRLSASIPECSGQVPVYYNYKNSYGAMRYCDSAEKRALYRFGEGSSYTEFSYDEIRCEKQDDGSVKVTVNIKNTGKRTGTSVPQLYIKRLEGSTTRRVRELKAFQRVELSPQEEKNVSLILEREAFGVWNRQMEYIVESGEAELYLKDQGDEFWSQKIDIGC